MSARQQAMNGRLPPVTPLATPLPQTGPNPLQRALEDYHTMEAQLAAAREEGQRLAIQNLSMAAEINMLREALERSDGDRIRLQAISSTLLGRLFAINDCIAGAVKASVKDGIEAIASHPAEQASGEAGEPAQSAEPPPAQPDTLIAIGTVLPPEVSWKPRG